MRPEFEIIGEESSGRADYAIKKRKRDDNDFKYLYRIITSPGKISQTSEVPLTIEFNKKALGKGSEEPQTLCNGVKKILGAINVLKGRSDSDNLGSACQVVFNIKKLKFLVKNIIKLTQRVGSSSCGLWDRTYSDEEPDRKRKNSTDISAENTEFRARVVTLERDIDDL
ncbi:hypothetical protein RhiirA1_464786 [Rhizophagus irregularis]|uniref:Uncharacterized protein n=1 Tax=Rhizophagus irregularis TaxID=588596 RepID=A0A2N0RHE2_9GLOM|nr:hypothetical protein RhiirA1_464786 [Rhizophagus irregularis]